MQRERQPLTEQQAETLAHSSHSLLDDVLNHTILNARLEISQGSTRSRWTVSQQVNIDFVTEIMLETYGDLNSMFEEASLNGIGRDEAYDRMSKILCPVCHEENCIFTMYIVGRASYAGLI